MTGPDKVARRLRVLYGRGSKAAAQPGPTAPSWYLAPRWHWQRWLTGLTNRPQRDVEKVTRRQTAAVSVGGSRVEGANQDGAEVAPTGRSVARRAFPGLRLADVAADPSTGMAWCKPLLFSSVEDQQ